MDKKKIDKATAIKSILLDLKKGIDKPTILGNFGNIWEIPKSTYYRWYEEADKQFKEFEARTNPIIEAMEIEAKGELAKAGILTKLERQKILSDLATGKVLSWREVPTKEGVERVKFCTASDVVKAIAELNKMDGAYIEDKTKENDFNGFELSEI